MSVIKDNETGHSFEIFPNDLPDKLTWKEAKSACRALGQGWRLPTTRELSLISSEYYEQNKSNFHDSNYWSSELCFDYQNEQILEMIGMAKDFDLELGVCLPGTSIKTLNRVRAVRKIE